MQQGQKQDQGTKVNGSTQDQQMWEQMTETIQEYELLLQDSLKVVQEYEWSRDDVRLKIEGFPRMQSSWGRRIRQELQVGKLFRQLISRMLPAMDMTRLVEMQVFDDKWQTVSMQFCLELGMDTLDFEVTVRGKKVSAEVTWWLYKVPKAMQGAKIRAGYLRGNRPFQVSDLGMFCWLYERGYLVGVPETAEEEELERFCAMAGHLVKGKRQMDAVMIPTEVFDWKEYCEADAKVRRQILNDVAMVVLMHRPAKKRQQAVTELLQSCDNAVQENRFS